jgi:trehalose 6-phosphate phosphatase
MPQPLFDHLPNIESRLRASGGVLLFLDFDGTLAPIVGTPDQAVLGPDTRVLLHRLSENAPCSVTIVSGRALVDIRERVGLANLTYAGNHGLEILGEGMRFVEPNAVQRIKILGELSRRLGERLRHIPGLEIENKVLTTSVHFRNVERSSLDEIRKTIDAEVGSSNAIFRVTRGLQVLEIRPRVDWDKGAAVRWIQDVKGTANTLSFYVGDDSTDEDAFAAMPKGITIRVGQAKSTAAQYYLEGQSFVAEFLAWLVEASGPGILNNPTQRPRVAGMRRS